MNSKSHFTNVWNFISSTLFSNKGYVSDTNYRVHDNYDVTDITELRLISSRRTFL